jgi:hypothetical protein
MKIEPKAKNVVIRNVDTTLYGWLRAYALKNSISMAAALAKAIRALGGPR